MQLVTAYLYVTLRCNARCGFCRIWREQNSAPPDLPLELGKRLLTDLRRLGAQHIDFTGGEPTLNSALPELLRFARDLGLFTSITTNGLLYQRRARELRGLVNLLGFSLNGPRAEIHDEAQGVRSFETTLRAIRQAKELGEPVHAHFTATNTNITHLEETIQLARRLQVPLMVFPEFSYFGNRHLALANLDHLERLSREPGVHMNAASLQFQRRGGNLIHRPTCRAGRSALAVSPEGALLVPCYHQSYNPIPSHGRLYDTYHDPKVQKILDRSGSYEFCAGCTNWCYINPSFLSHLSRFTLPHILSGVAGFRAVHGRRLGSLACRTVLQRLPGAHQMR